MVFGYKLQGSGGWSFNWLMHYLRQVYPYICIFWLMISRQCSTIHCSIISKLSYCVNLAWPLAEWEIVYNIFFSDCWGEWKGDASFVLLQFVLFINKTLTLFICENCTVILLVLETTYNINKCNSFNIKYQDFFLAHRHYRLSITDTKPRSRGYPQQQESTVPW